MNLKERLSKLGKSITGTKSSADPTYGFQSEKEWYPKGHTAILSTLQRSRDFCQPEESIAIQNNITLEDTKEIVDKLASQNWLVKKRIEKEGAQIDIVCLSDRTKAALYPSALPNNYTKRS